MRHRKGIARYSLLVFLFLMVTSCAPTTKLTALWKDETYDRPLRKVMVMGVSERPVVRRMFEREFTYQLQGYGVDVVPSFQIFPTEEFLERDVMVSKIRELNFDTVLITHLTNEEELTFVRYYQHYAGSYKQVYRDRRVYLETNIYDAQTENPVWSALSDTFLKEGTNMNKELRGFIKIMIKKMADDGLFEQD